MVQPPHNASISTETEVSELVIHIQTRDSHAHEAFQELHRRFDATIKSLLMYLVNMVSDKAGVVEELHQEIFWLVWRKLPSKNDNAPFDRWLRTVAKNVALDYLRRKKFNTVPLPEEEQNEEEGTYHNMVLFSVSGPEEQICQAESDEAFQTKVKGTLTKLSGGNRAHTCAVLYFIWGFSQIEIAEALNIDKKRVSEYVCEGRKKLRQTFSHLQETAGSEREGELHQ